MFYFKKKRAIKIRRTSRAQFKRQGFVIQVRRNHNSFGFVKVVSARGVNYVSIKNYVCMHVCVTVICEVNPVS